MAFDFTLTLPQLNFVKAHWNRDMSAFQMAKYFNLPEQEIHKGRIALKLPEQNLHAITSFHTPYPFLVGSKIRKFSWTNYYEDIVNGQTEIHSTDS